MKQKHPRKLRILILAHYYTPEMGGAAARIHGLARWLVNFGHHVTVLTGFPNYPTGVIPPAYRGKVRMHEEKDGVSIIRTWVYASSHYKNFGRLSNYISYVISSIITGLFTKDSYDVVLASSPPLLIGLVGVYLSRVRGIPFVFDIRDIWPDVAVDAGAFKPNNLLIRLSRELAQFLYRRADHITPVTKLKYKKIVAEGIQSAKLTVVPNGVDFDQLNTTLDIKWWNKLKLNNCFVVVYTGLIGIAQGVGVAVEAAKHLKENHDIHFLIVGDGVERQKLMKRASELNLNNVTFIPGQPRNSIPSILASANIALVPLVSRNLADAVPSKLMEAWACHKPVLLVAGGEAAELVEKAKGGIIVNPQKPLQLAEAVRVLSQNPDLLQKYAKNGYDFVRTHFDREDLARKMEKVLVKVSKKVEI